MEKGSAFCPLPLSPGETENLAINLSYWSIVRKWCTSWHDKPSFNSNNDDDNNNNNVDDDNSNNSDIS